MNTSPEAPDMSSTDIETSEKFNLQDLLQSVNDHIDQEVDGLTDQIKGTIDENYIGQIDAARSYAEPGTFKGCDSKAAVLERIEELAQAASGDEDKVWGLRMIRDAVER